MPTLNGDVVPYCGTTLNEHAANSPTAWGCRLIVSQDGYVDFVHDRQGAAGVDRDAFFRLLEAEFPISDLTGEVKNLLVNRRMDTRVGEEFVLYQSDTIVVRANTNGSGGYCYVVAYRLPDLEVDA